MTGDLTTVSDDKLRKRLATAKSALVFMHAPPHTLSRIAFWEQEKAAVQDELDNRKIT